MYLQSWHWGGGDRRMPGACWLAGWSYLVNYRPVGDPVSKRADRVPGEDRIPGVVFWPSIAHKCTPVTRKLKRQNQCPGVSTSSRLRSSQPQWPWPAMLSQPTCKEEQKELATLPINGYQPLFLSRTHLYHTFI